MSLWSRWLNHTLKHMPFRTRPSQQEERILRLAEMIGEPPAEQESAPQPPAHDATAKVE